MRRKKSKEDRKVRRQRDLEAYVFMILEKSLRAALDSAFDGFLDGWK